MHWAMRRLTRDFNPRPPRGGRLRDTSGCFASSSRFQSTPPARGATHGRSGHRFCSAISIHAPREGGDGDLPQQRIHMTISIHAPREGGRHGRRASPPYPGCHFNPRPPRGGRPPPPCRIGQQKRISIHAPREGGDNFHTPPARKSWFISIHAPREGGDSTTHVHMMSTVDFNPRPPRGGRRSAVQAAAASTEFQSTPPARGATPILRIILAGVQFQSTPPARGATFQALKHCVIRTFQSTPPARGATAVDTLVPGTGTDFNPRPPRGGRHHSYQLQFP